MRNENILRSVSDATEYRLVRDDFWPFLFSFFFLQTWDLQIGAQLLCFARSNNDNQVNLESYL